MSRANIPDEQPPFATESRLRDYLARMFRACKQTVDALFRWTADHVAITAPLYEEDPHQQYWHVVKDSAAAHMLYQDFTTGKALTDGQIVTGYDVDVHTPHRATTNLAAGTITAPDAESGLYTFFVGVTITDMQTNTTYFFTAYRNGVATALVLPIVDTGSITSGYNSFTGTAVLDPGDVIDLRMTGGNVTLSMCNVGIVRYLNTTEFNTDITSQIDQQNVPDPNWGQHGGRP